MKRLLVMTVNFFLLTLPALAWAAAPGEKAPDMATRQVKVVGISAVNAFFAGWYNSNKWVFAIIAVVLMAAMGGIIAVVTDLILKVIGMDVSKIEHHE